MAVMAVVLAGGKGTRLKPFTVTIPKPLLPLGDVPIVEVVLRQLAAAGMGRVALMLGHMSPLFTASIGDGSRWGVQLEYHVEEQPLGTAGPLRLLRDPPETLLVMNGDILTTLDYRALLARHRERAAAATIAVTQRQVPIDYGVLVSGKDDVLQEYREKPSLEYEVSMGINVVDRSCLDLIPADRPFDIPHLMQALQRAGRLVACYRTDCYWQDIGRFSDYESACEDFAAEPTRFLPDERSG